MVCKQRNKLIFFRTISVFKEFFFTPARTYSIIGLKSPLLKLTIFGLEMMKKSGLEFFILKSSKFRVAAAQCKQICPERLNYPGRLAGIS